MIQATDNAHGIPSHIGEFMSYDPASGEIRWTRYRGSRAPKGGRVGYVASDGYGRVRFDGKMHLLHRVAYFLMTGDQPSIVDHIDCNPANNQWVNLRAADASESARNRRPTGTVNPKGVRPSRGTVGRYRAEIKVRGKTINLGSFATESEASDAYREAAKRFHGEFARVE